MSTTSLFEFDRHLGETLKYKMTFVVFFMHYLGDKIKIRDRLFSQNVCMRENHGTGA